MADISQAYKLAHFAKDTPQVLSELSVVPILQRGDQDKATVC